jgi:hypothetical protein
MHFYLACTHILALFIEKLNRGRQSASPGLYIIFGVSEQQEGRASARFSCDLILGPGAAWRYFKTPSLFLFDVSTSFPFSYYDLAIYEVLLMAGVEMLIFEIHKQDFRRRLKIAIGPVISS